MLRRSIVRQLREVSEAAEKITSIQLENLKTGETTDMDAEFAKCLIRATLAASVDFIACRLKRQDPERVLKAIIQTTITRYVEGR